MGVYYHLYDRRSKEFINLGKRIFSQTDVAEFQMRSDRIAEFIASHATHGAAFEIFGDSGEMPEEDDPSWKCVGFWHDDQGRQ